jgi:nucleoside 2-deoxyribosyltransferase
MSTKHIYLAGPFFNQSEVRFTEYIAGEIKSRFAGRMTIFVPHQDSGVILTPQSPQELRRKVFQMDIDAMNVADIYVLLLDNEDSGTCFEMGYGYLRGIPMIALWSDVRKVPNLMLQQSATLVSNVEDLFAELNKLL